MAARCSEEKLQDYVGYLRLSYHHHSRLVDDRSRMDSKKLRKLRDRTCWVAREWEKQFRTSFGQELLRIVARSNPDGVELLNVPQRLLRLAGEAADIHRKTQHRRRPLYDDRLADLVVHVEDKTGKFHDQEVSALVAWAINSDRYSANDLCVWRHDHKEVLDRARLRRQKH